MPVLGGTLCLDKTERVVIVPSLDRDTDLETVVDVDKDRHR